ncbi:Stk1 family PASTA domain-containing Ser/Thr kinase [Miniimonas arenae]|uniref:Stk1 family PASTA domain-containing Ser/Thr kinase n=1 Tax=Miniimonas arenae TaxID=676201 RepID=UPI0028AEFA10|nr:Stk1 family PASTA domain-containing Ser/Thr kinase [Miniimonas arenae]
MSALVTDPLVGRTVDGRYDVLRRIARGGMATVYLATDRRLDRRVALKVMHPHLADGTDVEARFRREARAAARLAHPGIVAVLDQGTDGETSFLTMEYVPGRTLRTEIAGLGALRLGEALAITEGVLDALAAAHRAGLVHRDVKPENVMLTRDRRVKVGDFGLARAVTEATAASTGTLLGTVAYLSPEIVSVGEADARADVYAVGIMLYEMITGSPPYDGVTPIQIAYRHVHEDVPPPSDAVPWLPMDVDDLVATLTARDLSVRPADAGVALEHVRRLRRDLDDRALALRASVPGRPDLLVDAAPDLPDDQASAESLDAASEDGADHDRTTALDRGPGTGTIALPIGAIAPREEETVAVAPERPARRTGRRRGRRALVVLLVLLLLGAGGGAAWWFLLGPGSPVVVPPVVGRDATEVTAQLTDLDLEVSQEPAYDDTAPEGAVLAVDPGAGTSVPRGSEVTLTVSLGIEHRTVPTLVGLTQDEAEAALEQAQLAVGDVVPREDRDVPEGVVLDASEDAGASVPHTETIDLVVSSGPRVVTIDDYVGKGTESDIAVTDLARVLDITDEQITVTEVYSDTVPQGRVVSQTPEPGAEVPQGTPAALEVSKGPELVAVPDVERMSLADATAVLEGAGFVVSTKSSWGGLIGTVVDQSPAAGEMLARGSTVTLTYV